MDEAIKEHITINDSYTFSRINVDTVMFENAWCADERSGTLQPHAPDYRRGWGMVIFAAGSTPAATFPPLITPAPTMEPGATPSPQATEGIVVKDGDSGFILSGPSEYWHRATSGSHYYGGDVYWTYVNGDVICNSAKWQPVLHEAGSCSEQVFIDWDSATTSSALYRVEHASGADTVRIDQNDYADEWVDIGTCRFDAGNAGYVELADTTGENQNSLLKIGFDAVRWTQQ